MISELKVYSADHRFLLEQAGRACGFADPVAIDLGEFHEPLLKAAVRGALLPLDGVLVRDWDSNNRSTSPGVHHGARAYHVQGVTFVHVCFAFGNSLSCWALDFVAADRKDYRKLYRLALQARLRDQPAADPPVLPADQLDLLWKNTIGYLETRNLDQIRAYGGRARRGVLLTGSPGNGKTMACRYVWETCRQRRWEYRLVTPDNYRQARTENAIKELFSVERRGIVFFDDMDLALRDREKVAETEDQSVFLSAMDGIEVKEGVVFVFTTNCSLDLIDRAFKRPGRLDVVLNFRAPDAGLRRRLIERWHPDVVAALDLDEAVASTDGYSFAEVEELRHLLVMRYVDVQEWDWKWALRQFAINRSELTGRPARQVGFNKPGGRPREEEMAN